MERKSKYSPEFVELMKTINEPCELKSPKEPPPWLNKSLYLKGLSVIWSCYFGISIGILANFVLGLSNPNVL